MDPTFQTFESDRLDEIIGLEHRCYPSPWSNDALAAEFDEDYSVRYALFQYGGIIAYSFSHFIAGEVHILNLAVAPKVRGIGIGSLLLAELLRAMAGKKATNAMLEVRLKNQVAQRLYRSFGFKVEGMRRHYYHNDGDHALLMERLIDDELLEICEATIARVRSL